VLHSAHSDSSSDVILPPAHQGLPQPPASAGAPEVVELHDFEEFEDVSEFEEYSPEPPVASTQPAAVPQIVAPPVVEARPLPRTILVTPPPIAPLPIATPPVPPQVPVTSVDRLLKTLTDEKEEPFQARPFESHGQGPDLKSTLISMVVHLIGLFAISFIAAYINDEKVVAEVAPDFETEITREVEFEKIVTFELDNPLHQATQETSRAFSSSMDLESGGGGGGGNGSLGSVGGSGDGPGGAGGGLGLDKGVMESLGKGEGIAIEGLFIETPSSTKLIVEAPDGMVGDARAVVDSYNEALDRITQEILWMLDKGPVLVVLAFDQSESMKDDQREIRDRIEHVYRQLGLVSKHNRSALETAVVSYGESYIQHTRKPTSDWYEIKACMDEVPVDPSGKEMMCSTVTQAIGTHRAYAERTNRQMCLVLCTDESGEPPDNQTNLERAVAEAKAAKCKIFTIGREAVFGYPYAQLRWLHPQTGHHHWIQIDRGPETGFVEQLQTDGFHRRFDAHPSGFGPYEQSRLSRETGGVFFLLPSLETNLVRGEKRKYELEQMRRFLPDLRSRMEVGQEIESSELSRSLTKVIYDLNPHQPEIAKIIVMRVHFSPDLPNLMRQIQIECAKATIYGEYLSRVEQELARLEKHRRHESLPRWQANYDLIYAQVIAYQARMFEYRAYLQEFARKPKFVPATKPPNLRHTGWDIHTRKELLTGKTVEPFIERATARFHAVITDHAGTPWAARAEYELKRGFGVHLIEEYHGPGRTLPTGTVLMPVPKM
jgi:hypothetical protein